MGRAVVALRQKASHGIAAESHMEAGEAARRVLAGARPRDAAMSRLFRLLGWLAVVIVGGYAVVAWVVGCVG
jgi:cell division septal protein FtsQ